jgi:hypothetical protein
MELHYPEKQKIIESMIQRGYSHNALRLLNDQIRQDPQAAIWYRLKLFALDEAHRTNESQRMIPVVKEKFPNSVEAMIASALTSGLYSREKNKRLLAAKKSDPEDPFIDYLYGKFCYYQENYYAALIHFQDCLTKCNTFFLAMFLYGNCLSGFLMPELASKQYECILHNDVAFNKTMILVRKWINDHFDDYYDLLAPDPEMRALMKKFRESNRNIKRTIVENT